MRHLARLLVAVGIFSFAGCGPGTPNGNVLCPVEGRLLVSGIPAANAHVTFHPIEGAAGTALSVGRTGPDGSFRLTTFAAGDGAPAGEYVVTVVWPNDSIPRDECVEPTTH